VAFVAFGGSAHVFVAVFAFTMAIVFIDLNFRRGAFMAFGAFTHGFLVELVIKRHCTILGLVGVNIFCHGRQNPNRHKNGGK